MSRVYAQQKRPAAKAAEPSYSASAAPVPSLVSRTGSSDLDAMMHAKYRQHFLDNQIPTAEAEADRIAASVSGARTPEEVKTQLGEKMGADFSNVTFHTDSAALKQAEAMGARAYTSGSDVYFGSGGFDPGVAAHELVHTVQQGMVGSSMQTTSAPTGGVQMSPKQLPPNPKKGRGRMMAAGGYDKHFASLNPEQMVQELVKLKAYLNAYKDTQGASTMAEQKYDPEELHQTYHSVLQQMAGNADFQDIFIRQAGGAFDALSKQKEDATSEINTQMAAFEESKNSDAFVDELYTGFKKSSKYTNLKKQLDAKKITPADFNAQQEKFATDYYDTTIESKAHALKSRVYLDKIAATNLYTDARAYGDMFSDINSLALTPAAKARFEKISGGSPYSQTTEGAKIDAKRDSAMATLGSLKEFLTRSNSQQSNELNTYRNTNIRDAYTLPELLGETEQKKAEKKWLSARNFNQKLDDEQTRYQEKTEKHRAKQKAKEEKLRRKAIRKKEDQRIKLMKTRYLDKPEYDKMTLQQIKELDVTTLPEAKKARKEDKLTPPKRASGSRFFHRQFFGSHKERSKYTEPKAETSAYKASPISIPVGGNSDNMLQGYKYTPNRLKPSAVDKPKEELTPEDRIQPNGQSVILFSGTGGDNFGQMQNMIQAYTDKGYTVYGVDYRGFGKNDRGKDFRVSEFSLNKDARSIYDYVTGEQGEGANPNNVLLHGFSMGGAVASRLAADISKSAKNDDSKKLGGLVLHSSMKDLKSAATEQVGTGSIARWAGRKSEEKLGRFSAEDALDAISATDKEMPIYMISGGKEDGLALEHTLLDEKALGSGLQNLHSYQGNGRHLEGSAAPAGHINSKFLSTLKKGMKRIFGHS